MIRLEPYNRKKQINEWNSQVVSQLILEMKRAKEPLTLRSLCVGRRPEPSDLLTKVIGKPTTKQQLHRMACHYYGSWRGALQASQIAPRKPSHNSYWTQELIIRCIQRLHKTGHPLTVKSVWYEQVPKTDQILGRITHHATTAAGLHNAAQRFLGSWDNALQKAGIDVESIKEKPFWTKKKAIKVILALEQNHIPLNSALQVDCSTKTSTIIKKVTGKSRTGRSLYGAAFRMFGTWDQALVAAGLDPKKFRAVRFKWNKKSISRVLKALHRSKVPINVAGLSARRDELTRDIIFQTSGRRIRGQTVYNIGRKKLGSWDEFLKYSGFTPSTIRKRGRRCEHDKELVIELIQYLHINGFKLNLSSVLKDSKKIQKFIEKKIDRAVSGYSIINVSKKLFGSWHKALWEAGLNPNEICLRSPSNTTHLPIVLYQVEDVKINGERWREKYLGAPPKSPDQILEEREASKKLKSAVMDMKYDEKDLTDRIFDAILQVHHYKNQKQLIQHVTRILGGGITEKKVETIFTKLASKLERP